MELIMEIMRDSSGKEKGKEVNKKNDERNTTERLKLGEDTGEKVLKRGIPSLSSKFS
jgi:hypothetical protein